MKYIINGFLFSQRQTGVMRYAKEILKKLDLLVENKDIELVVPNYTKEIPDFINIKTTKLGNTKGNLWEQTCFSRYVRKSKGISINFNNTCPYIGKSIIFIHDIAYKLHPEFATSFHGKLSNLYHKIIFKKAAKGDLPIVTVSYFSKYQLIDFYHINPNRIYVIGSAWQQMNDIDEDSTILERLSLKEKQFYFSLGSLSKMKNTKWILEVAKKNPNNTFVISGAKSNATKNDFEKLDNVIYTGYIKDSEIKSLMKKCKAFLYPSIYEGFGLPPLEAMSQGAKVICTSCASLAEVYGNTVVHIDPYKTDINLDDLSNEEVCNSKFALDKYSWEKSATQLYKLLYESKEGEGR